MLDDCSQLSQVLDNHILKINDTLSEFNSNDTICEEEIKFTALRDHLASE